MADMKALPVTRHGPPENVLAVRAVERPEPGPNEVRVEVRAASLNFDDVGKRVAMEEAGAALDRHEARRSMGRTVVEVRVGAPGTA